MPFSDVFLFVPLKFKEFLGQFSKLDLAHGNYGVNEYARALMYLEDYLMEQKEMIKNEEHLSFLEVKSPRFVSL